MSEIRFYGRTSNPEYWPFSNFYPAPFIDRDGIRWPTTEHFFQAMKFLPNVRMQSGGHGGDSGITIREHIRSQKTPMDTAKEGRRRDFPLRSNWEIPIQEKSGYKGFLVKDIMMLEALGYKFTQHEDLKQLLLETGDAEIIEDSPTDYYWGCGKDGFGKNMLGKLLMLLRDELKG
jgi:ribA/ribD-fused uncharacterized protein